MNIETWMWLGAKGTKINTCIEFDFIILTIYIQVINCNTKVRM